MSKLLPPEEYYKSLPTKRMGAGVIFFNDKDEILLVKPNYKDYWTVPGGTVDADESPRDAAVREVKEEIGLCIKEPIFICVDYNAKSLGRTDCLQFLFLGERLTPGQISSIKLQKDELDEFKFFSKEKIKEYLGPHMKKRLSACLDAIRKETGTYLETKLDK